MARMLPRIVSAGTKSNAERKLYEKMKHDLTDEWSVIHSLGLASHNKKPWAEIDFVLIGPDGVYCLEVKGGRVRRSDGVWFFTNRNNETSSKSEGPFDQVGSTSAALYQHLRDRLGHFGGVVGYGVCFPDIEFRQSGPDVNSETVYDERDGMHSFTEYLGRLSAHWREWIRSHHGRIVERLDKNDRQAVLNTLQGDFDLMPSLRSLVDAANNDLIRLTDEQERAVGIVKSFPRALITGCAGSGKTLLAVNEAQRLAELGNKVFLCCYNKHLAAYLRRAVTHKNIDVMHLHGFMAGVISQAGLMSNIPKADDDDLYGLFFPMYCLEGLGALGRREQYDAIIVDEAQDLLRDAYLEVLGATLKGGLEQGRWRIYLDPKQNVYLGIGKDQIAKLQQYSGGGEVQLQWNCRNTAPVSVFTQLLSGIHFDEIATVEGPEVQHYWYRDEEHQRKQVSNCLNRFLSAGIKPERIVMLSPRRLENSGLRNGLKAVPYQLRSLGNDVLPTAGTISFSTIRAFKGLEADVVVLIDLDDLTSNEMMMETYVGSSRAKTLLAVFLHEGMKEEYAKRAEAFGHFLGERT